MTPVILTMLLACSESTVQRGSGTNNASINEQSPLDKRTNNFSSESGISIDRRTGEQVYSQVCVTCHQANGQGIVGMYPPLAGSEWMNKSSETLIKIVLHGLMGEVEVKGVRYNNVMSPWGAVLQDEETANVLTYVRNSWGNSGAEISVQEVTEIRRTFEGHSPWQQVELGP